MVGESGGSAEDRAPRYMGFVVLDRCPLNDPVSLAPGADMVPIGALTPAPILALLSQVIGVQAKSDALEHDYRHAHQCALMRVLLPDDDFDKAFESWNAAAESHYLPVLHYLRPPASVLFTGVVELATRSWRLSWRLQRRSWQLAQKPSLQEYYAFANKVAAADRKTRLLLGLFHDFMRDMYADKAILHGWTLLETMSQVVPSAEVDWTDPEATKKRARLALSRLGVHRTDFSVTDLDEKYSESGQDTIAAAYQHRNCVSHEGACDQDNSRCSQRKWREGACREGERLRDDLEWLLQWGLYGYVRLAAQESQIGLYVGSTQSRAYHTEECAAARRICPENRVLFHSSPDAQCQGYVPCRTCLPHIAVEDQRTFIVGST